MAVSASKTSKTALNQAPLDDVSDEAGVRQQVDAGGKQPFLRSALAGFQGL